MQPIKLQRMKRTNCWQPARRVWFQHNSDKLGPNVSDKEEEEAFGKLGSNRQLKTYSEFRAEGFKHKTALDMAKD